MKQVASLQYGVIFKKAFSQVDIFVGFVEAVLGIRLEIDKVETEKSFRPAVGSVDSRFDLFAQDDKNRIIVDIQHRQTESHYDRFLHYHCAAIVEQMPRGSSTYRPKHTVFTIVVLTSNDRHEKDVLTIDFDPKDLQGQPINEISHKVVFLCPKYVNENTPAAYREWMEAINDTLDAEVDESHYHNALIHKVFTAIEEDGLTPTDRYNIIEEAEDKRFIEAERKKAITEATLQNSQTIAKNSLAAGLSVDVIAQITGLTPDEIQQLRD